VKNRGVTRCYLANLFPSQQRFRSPAAPRGGSRADGGSLPPPSLPAGHRHHPQAV
jgi:hypothetical protein